MQMTNDIKWNTDFAGKIKRITTRKMSNLHAHLRRGPLMHAVAAELMRHWNYLLVMPNTGPITTIPQMVEYHNELCAIRDRREYTTRFIMTLYLTQALTPGVVEEMQRLKFPSGVKYYPPEQGATTGSGCGLPLTEAHETLVAMSRLGVPLLGHFESVKDHQGNLLPQEKREDYFMAHVFPWLRDAYPDLRINIEHATTRAAIRRVKEDTSGNTTCGITPQAMLLTRENLESLSWGVHAKCMPIAKTPEDVEAVRDFALSGDVRCHLGDDTAPHASRAKLKPFGEAASGCYLPHAIALYVHIFEKYGKLENLPAFSAFNGPRTWGLQPPRDGQWVTLVRDTEMDIPPPTEVPELEDEVIPFGYSTKEDAFHPGWRIEE